MTIFVSEKMTPITIAFIMLLSHLAGAQEDSMHDMGDHAIPGALLKASVEISQPLKPGQPSTLILKLTKANGTPVTMAQLQEMHTKKIHLLIADETLTDYRHVHPMADSIPGSYIASFIPKKADNYKIWVDVAPVGGSEQYIPILLQGEKPCAQVCIDKTLSNEGVAGNLRAKLSFEDPLKTGAADMGIVKITDAAGKPVTDLEPVMGAFAHIVAFYEDFATIAHVHPMGKEPIAETDRGGPDLSFHIEPVKAGFIRLYVQVRRAGKDVFIPLGVNVE